MNTKKKYIILLIAITIIFIITSCKDKKEEDIDAMAKDGEGEVIHMDIKEDFNIGDLSEPIAIVDGEEIYLPEYARYEIEGYLNAYVDGFEELYRMRKVEGYSRKDIQEGINEGFSILYRSHIEEAIREHLYIKDLIKRDKVKKEKIEELNDEELHNLVIKNMNKEISEVDVKDEKLDEYIEKNQGDLIRYDISYLKFSNGENIEEIKRYIDEGKSFDDIKEFLTFGDDIEVDFEGSKTIYRRCFKINYDNLYNRKIIGEYVELLDKLDDKKYAVDINYDKTKYRLLRLDDKQVDPGFIRKDLKKLYQTEKFIDEIDDLWNQSKIEILVGKEPLFK